MMQLGPANDKESTRTRHQSVELQSGAGRDTVPLRGGLALVSRIFVTENGFAAGADCESDGACECSTLF